MFKEGVEVKLTEQAKQNFKNLVNKEPSISWDGLFLKMVHDGISAKISKVEGTRVWIEENFFVYSTDVELVENVKENKMELEKMCSEELVDLINQAEAQLKMIRDEKEKPLHDLVEMYFCSSNDCDDIFSVLYSNADKFIEALEHVKGIK